MKKLDIRKEIVDEPLRRPWAARVDFLLQAGDRVRLDGEACLLGRSDIIIRIGPHTDPRSDDQPHLRRYRAEIEGFAFPSEAEAAGLMLSLSILWSAISWRFAVRLDYHTPDPAIVYDRTASSGRLSDFGRPSITRPVPPEIGELLTDELPRSPDSIDRLMLLSMELFAAARLEMSERAKFVNLVSALEPLATPLDYPEPIAQLLEGFRAQLRAAEFPDMGQEEVQTIKNSLHGRIRELRRESIRQALLRTVRTLLPDDSSSKETIDSAYGLRSKMLHEGVTDPYLDRRIAEVENTMRRLYAARIGRQLAVPAASA